MATGATLGEMIANVQEEISASSLPSLGQNFRAVITSRINREYERLLEDFDWPHLNQWYDEATVAGQRYYDLPDGMSLGGVQQIWYLWGGEYTELKRGIDVSDYNGQNSDDDYRSDPAQRWRPYIQQIEIHPIPATASSLRILGKLTYAPLVEESDRCALDKNLVCLFASAKLLKRRGAEEADVVMGEAVAHYNTLKQRSQTGARFNFTGGCDHTGQGFEHKTLVGIRST